jgi:hypothetical protein
MYYVLFFSYPLIQALQGFKSAGSFCFVAVLKLKIKCRFFLASFKYLTSFLLPKYYSFSFMRNKKIRALLSVHILFIKGNLVSLRMRGKCHDNFAVILVVL